MNEIPESVRTFLRENIESYEHLEILVQLLRSRERTWTLEQVAQELRLAPGPTLAALQYLTARGLLVESARGTYSYAPRVEALDRAAVALVQAYDRDRLEIMKLMNAHAVERLRSSILRTFAEAFRMRGPRSDG